MMHLAILAVVLAMPAWGAIALVRTPDFGGQAAGAQVIAVVLGTNSTAGNFIIGIASGEGSTCVTSVLTVSDSRGTGYSAVLKQLGTSQQVQWAFFGFVGTTGANTVQIDWGAGHSCVRGAAYVAEYSGVGSVDKSVSAGEGIGSTAADSGAMGTTTANNDVLFCGVAAFALSRTFTAGTYDGTHSYTIRAQQNTVDSTVVGDATTTTTGAYHCRMTLNSSAQWAAHALALKAATTTPRVIHKVTN